MEKNVNPSKALQSQSETDKKIIRFLKVVPYISYSDNILEHLANRFDVSLGDLKELIKKFENGGWHNE
jgi:hypothetical protein